MSDREYKMNAMVYAAIIAVAILRLISIAVSPLGLDVEEAQYWQWSTTPDLGYFTKPPMIAWVIGAGTALFGDNSIGIRALAPIIQALSAILMMRIAGQCFGLMAGRIAAILWLTLPISAMGGFIISTDSPMLLFLLAALYMLTPLAQLKRPTFYQTLLAGLFTGLAMMSKYAAIYLPLGILLWWLWDGRRHHVITLKALMIYGGGGIISLLPNLIWNLQNGFVTARHLGHNANLDEPQYSLMGSVEFLMAQMGIVGPIIAVLAVFVMIIRRTDSMARFWISLFIPAITVITVQGYFSDANANWAVASWPPALILLAGYCAEEWRRIRRPFMIGIGINTGIMLVFLAAVMVGSFGPITPASDPLRRLRAWDNHAEDIKRFADIHNIEHIVVFRRGYAAKLIWALRDTDLELAIVDRNGVAENHFEQQFPWMPQSGQQSIFINGRDTAPRFDDVAGAPQVRWLGIDERSDYAISEKRRRKLVMHIGVAQ